MGEKVKGQEVGRERKTSQELGPGLPSHERSDVEFEPRPSGRECSLAKRMSFSLLKTDSDSRGFQIAPGSWGPRAW